MRKQVLLRVMFFVTASTIPIGLCASSTAEIYEKLVAQQQQQGKLSAYDLPGVAALSMPEIIQKFLQAAEIAADDIVLTEQEVQVETTAWLNGRPLDLFGALMPSDEQEPKVVMVVPLPDGCMLSEFIPLLGKLDLLALENVDLTITNQQYIDEGYEQPLQPGVNLIGTLILGGPLQYLSWIIGDLLPDVQIMGLLQPSIIGSVFAASLPGKISFFGGITLENLGLSIGIGDSETGLAESLGTIGGALTVKIPGREQFIFNSAVDLFTDRIELSGSMDGIMEDLFGVYGLDAGNWFVNGTVEYMLLDGFSSLVPLTDFSLGFDLLFAGKQVRMASKLGLPGEEGLGEVAFEGTLTDQVSLQDCVEFMGNVIENTPSIEGGLTDYQASVEGVAPDFELGDVHLFFSPTDVEINGIQYSKGLIIDGKATVLGSDTELHIDVQESGMRIFGYLEDLEFGPVRITGPGPDMIMDTPDDGLIFDAVLGLDDQHCVVAAAIEVDIFGGISTETKIDVSSSGIVFETEKDLFDLFEFGLIFSAQLNDTGIPVDFYVNGHMNQTALSTLQDILSKTAYRTALLKMERYQNEKRKIRQALNPIDQNKFNIFESLANAYDGFWHLLANLVGKTFNIQEFSFEGSLEELVDNSCLPSVTIKGIVLGKEFELNDITFDLSDPIGSSQSIVEALSDLF